MTEFIDYAFPGYRVFGVDVGTKVMSADGIERAVTESASITVEDRMYVNRDIYEKMKVTPAPPTKMRDMVKFNENMARLFDEK